MATQLEIAEHLVLSDRQVRNLITGGVLPKHKGRAGYSLDACRVAYIEHLRGPGGKVEPTDEESLDLERERAKNLQLDSELKQRKLDHIDRTVAPIHILEWVLSHLSTQLSAILGAIPQKVRRRAPRLSASEVLLIEKEVVKCQNLAAAVTIDLEEYEAKFGADNGG
jgi:terminase small subunit / prophage DNA-packing protein